MNGGKLTELLAERLHIELPPVALTFVEECPPEVTPLGKEPPSFCTLWRWGEERVFYASGEQHLGCALGGMVAGFLPPEGKLDELAAALQEMCEDGGDGPDEIARTARFAHGANGIVYGPLWKFPLEPDVLLLWATLPQMGVLQEVAGTTLWRDNPQGAVFTRPACSVLAIASEHEKLAMSLGCIGMRLYTRIPPQLFLEAIPRSKLSQVEEGLEGKADAEERLRFYEEKLRTGMAQG